jgi:cytochrome c biogenesis protein CcdA
MMTTILEARFVFGSPPAAQSAASSEFTFGVAFGLLMLACIAGLLIAAARS